MGKTFKESGRKNYDQRQLDRVLSECKDRGDFRKIRKFKSRQDWNEDINESDSYDR